jgi:hypothetical protein
MIDTLLVHSLLNFINAKEINTFNRHLQESHLVISISHNINHSGIFCANQNPIWYNFRGSFMQPWLSNECFKEKILCEIKEHPKYGLRIYWPKQTMWYYWPKQTMTYNKLLLTWTNWSIICFYWHEQSMAYQYLPTCTKYR